MIMQTAMKLWQDLCQASGQHLLYTPRPPAACPASKAGEQYSPMCGGADSLAEILGMSRNKLNKTRLNDCHQCSWITILHSDCLDTVSHRCLGTSTCHLVRFCRLGMEATVKIPYCTQQSAERIFSRSSMTPYNGAGLFGHNARDTVFPKA